MHLGGVHAEKSMAIVEAAANEKAAPKNGGR